ncbi:hypothetical protein HK097_000933, partial [Rhizophlyctis rosea]
MPGLNQTAWIYGCVGASLVALLAGVTIWRTMAPPSLTDYEERVKAERQRRLGSGVGKGGGAGMRKGSKGLMSMLLGGETLYPPGLVNLGNTCFMNSVIQALASLPSLYIYLHQRCTVYYSPEVPEPDEEGKKPLPMTEALLDLISELNKRTASRRYLKPNSFMSALAASSKSSRRMLCYDQQDAHELMQLVTSAVTTEEDPRPPLIHSLLDIKTIQEQRAEKGTIAYCGKKVDWRLPEGLRSPLMGLMASTLTCMQCGYATTARHYAFENITVPLPHRQQCTIEGLLSQYVSPEILDDYNCDRCSLKATLARLERDLEKQAQTAEAAKEQLARIRRKIKKKQEREANGVNAMVNGDASPIAPPPLDGPGNETTVGNFTVEAQEGKVTRGPGEVDEAVLLQKAEKRYKKELGVLVRLRQDQQTVKDAIMQDVERELPKHIKRSSLGGKTTKQLMIAAPPKALCLHMQRSIFLPTGGILKNNCRVQFDEFLDVGP